MSPSCACCWAFCTCGVWMAGSDGSEGSEKTAAHAQTRWKALWDRGAFPLEPLDYLRQVQGHFCLFHPETLSFGGGETGGDGQQQGKMLELNPAEKEIRYLIGTWPRAATRCCSLPGQTKEISCAEAARWLVHMNAFDVSPGGAPPRERGFRANSYMKLPGPTPWGWFGRRATICLKP